MYVMHNRYIEAVDPLLSSTARYISSSGVGYNNAAISPHHRYGTHTINIVATRDIAPGEEVFMPYGSSYHTMRAPPLAKQTVTTPPSHWKEHMYAPKQQQQDGRVKWRINKEVDWKLFQQCIEPQLKAWMRKYKQWMPPQSRTQSCDLFPIM